MCDRKNMRRLINRYRSLTNWVDQNDDIHEAELPESSTLGGMETAWKILHPEQPSLRDLAFFDAKLVE